MDQIVVETRRRPPFPVRVLAAGLLNLLGLWIAGLLDLVFYDNDFWVLLLAALVLAAVNILVRPVTMILSIPFILVTFGFFILVINAFMLWITDLVVPDFELLGFWRTIGAAIVVGLANLLFGGIMRDFTERPRREVYEV